ncbi:MAG: hypothetical protein WDO24_06565 [Pseudomonadota bacterium]
MAALDIGPVSGERAADRERADLDQARSGAARRAQPVGARLGRRPRARGPASAIYLSGMLTWLLVLGRNPMSTAYPIGIGLSLASTTLAAMLVLGRAGRRAAPSRHRGHPGRRGLYRQKSLGARADAASRA